jgi:chemotaxis protein MotB
MEKRTGQLNREYQDKLAALAAQAGSGMGYDKDQGKLTLEAGVFFKSGSDSVLPAAKKTILEVCQALKDAGVRLHIVGHTDNEPITKSKDKFADNWDLSGARAVAVLREMAAHGSIAAKRLSFEGQGEVNPVSDNATPAGRAKNRRVEIFIREG